MPEVRERLQRPGPGVDYSELVIPDDANLGTGRYTMAVTPAALSGKTTTSGAMVKSPVFQLSLNVNPLTDELTALVGRADGTPPTSNVTFRLPPNLIAAQLYVFRLDFEGWAIKGLSVNDMALTPRETRGN